MAGGVSGVVGGAGGRRPAPVRTTSTQLFFPWYVETPHSCQARGLLQRAATVQARSQPRGFEVPDSSVSSRRQTVLRGDLSTQRSGAFPQRIFREVLGHSRRAGACVHRCRGGRCSPRLRRSFDGARSSPLRVMAGLWNGSPAVQTGRAGNGAPSGSLGCLAGVTRSMHDLDDLGRGLQHLLRKVRLSLLWCPCEAECAWNRSLSSPLHARRPDPVRAGSPDGAG